VIPADHLDLSEIAGRLQHDIIFKPQRDLMEEDLGSRDKIYAAKGLVWYPAETDVSIRPGWFYRESEDKQVKTPRQLMDIYFTSVGMNGVLLLNIPPDKNGRINEHDVQSLLGFKSLFNKTFSANLATGALATSNNGVGENLMLDSKYKTYFTTTTDADTTTTIEIMLSDVQTFNVLCLQENIAAGQRIEQFSLEYLNPAGEWHTITTGTTVGYKRLLRFEEVAAGHLRLKILSSRLNPTLSEFGLYLLPSE
jgi:alpha-L-fucosidase